MSKKLAKCLCVVLSLVLILPVFFTGCKSESGSSDSKVVNLRFGIMGWKQNSTDPASILAYQMLDQFQKDNPNIKITYEVSNGDAMQKTIKVAAAGDNLPDFWQFWPGGTNADYAKAGLLLDMNKYMEAPGVQLKKSDFSEDAWTGASYNGTPVCIPSTASMGMLLINKKLFDKYNLTAPKTWEEFLAVGKAFKSHGVIPTNLGSKGGNPSHFWFGDLACQYNDGVTASANIGTTYNFNNSAFLKAAQYCEQMRKAGMFPDDVVANGDWDPSVAIYASGKSAMCYTFSWMTSQITGDLLENTEIIPLPKLPDGDRDPSTFVQGTVSACMNINAKSFEDPAKQAAIIKTVNFVTKDIELALSQKGYEVPSDQSVLKKIDLDSMDNKMLAKYYAYRIKNNVQSSPMIWLNMPNTQTQSDYSSNIDLLWAGGLNAQQFVSKTQESLDNNKASAK